MAPETGSGQEPIPLAELSAEDQELAIMLAGERVKERIRPGVAEDIGAIDVTLPSGIVANVPYIFKLGY